MNNKDNLPEPDRDYPASSPQEIDAREVRRRYSFTLWVAAAACLLYGVTLSAYGLWWPFGIGDFVLCMLFILLRHWTLTPPDNRRMTIGTHLLAALGGLLLCWHTYYSGLADSFAVWYFALLPITVALLGRLRIVAEWTLISLLLIALTHTVQRLWPAAPQLVLTNDLVAFTQMMLVLMTTLYSIAALRANDSHLDYLRRAYKTLLAQRDLLDRKTAELNRSLRDAEEARAAADAASATKSEFLAMMSHEIRTPLNGVIGLNTLLLDLPLDEKARHYAELARQSGDALLALVNDFLDFSRMEAGGLTLEEIPFDPRRVMTESVSVVAASAREKGLDIRCEVDAPAQLLGDPSRLRQILVNLLANAVKFTAEGEVRLVSSPLPRAGAQTWLRIEVRDTGIGIDPAAQQRLFQPFIQADVSTTRRYGGTGLGLAICRALAVHMGGQIGVQSERGKGSTFWVELPFGVPATAGVADADTPAATTRRHFTGRVLIAEDNVVNQLVAREMIGRFGLATDVVVDGEQAVHAVDTRDYDLVLMDCHMPGVDGYTATRRIRALGNPRSRVKIVAMTAGVLVGDEEKCRAAGMDDFIAKPLRLVELEKMLARWLPDKPRTS